MSNFNSNGVYKPKKYVGVNRINMVQGAGLKKKDGSFQSIVTGGLKNDTKRPHESTRAARTYTTRGGEKFLASALGMGLKKSCGGSLRKSTGRGLMDDLSQSGALTHGGNYIKHQMNDVVDRSVNHVKDRYLPPRSKGPSNRGLFDAGEKVSKHSPNPALPGYLPRYKKQKFVGAPSGIGTARTNYGRRTGTNTRPPKGIKPLRNNWGFGLNNTLHSKSSTKNLKGRGLIKGFGGA